MREQGAVAHGAVTRYRILISVNIAVVAQEFGVGSPCSPERGNAVHPYANVTSKRSHRHLHGIEDRNEALMMPKLKMLEGVTLDADHDTSGDGVSKAMVSSWSRRTYLVQDDQRIHLNMPDRGNGPHRVEIRRSYRTCVREPPRVAYIVEVHINGFAKTLEYLLEFAVIDLPNGVSK